MDIAKVRKTSLLSPFNSTDTTLTLKDFVDHKGTVLALTDFDSTFVVVIRQGSVVEMVLCDGLTQNADGSATLDVATNGRDLAATYPYAGGSTGEDFGSGADVVCGNDPYTIYQITKQYTNDTAFAGAPDSADTVKGITERATVAQINAGTADGSDDTTAPLGVTAERLASSIYNTRLPSADEKAAMAGDTTPGATNTFITKGKEMTAGAIINGGTLPVPVYQNKTDNEFYACDANDTAAMKFLGFAISDGTDGAAMNVQFSGIVSGFTGLSEGEKYYVQDAVGTIGTSIGTYEILVGIAISETELLIQKGKRRASGQQSSTITATGSIVVDCGFRPSVVRVFVRGIEVIADEGISTLDLVWNNGATKAINSWAKGSNSRCEAVSTLYYNTPSNHLVFTITSVTDTGFTITYTETGNYNQPTSILWEAEGEL